MTSSNLCSNSGIIYMVHRVLLVITLLALAFHSAGQQTIRGVVRDAENREVLIGVHILGSGRESQGTSSNTEGRFSLQLDFLPDSLRISCIGYRSKTLLRKAYLQEPLDISLEPYSTPLKALSVKPASAVQLIKDALQKMPLNYAAPPFQIRGFYREVIKNDSVYYSVAEAVFENQLLKKENAGLLKLIQGRRSETVASTRMFEDYHPAGGPNFLVNNMIELSVPEFLQEKNFEDYVYSIDSITSYDGQDVYQIGFDQRDNINRNLWSGTVYIMAESHAIIGLTYSLSDKGIAYRKHLVGTDKVMAELLGIDYIVNGKSIRYSYRKKGNIWVLHNASLEMNIHYNQPRKDIDESFSLKAEMLALRQMDGPLKAFPKGDQWQKNRLVKSLPGEFDEGFWGTDNFVEPEKSLTEAVAAMDVLRAEELPPDAPHGWNLLHAPEAKAYRKDSTLILKPYMESRWRDSEQGPFLFQQVSGDMEVYARMIITKTLDTTASPDAGFQVGGLMLRSPGDGPENYVFFAIGCMGNPRIKIIGESTMNGRTATKIARFDTHEVHMRMRRIGKQVQLHYLSSANQQWVLLKEIQRSDFPDELQVGIAGYAWVPGSGPDRHPDLLIRAQGFRVKSLSP